MNIAVIHIHQLEAAVVLGQKDRIGHIEDAAGPGRHGVRGQRA